MLQRYLLMTGILMAISIGLGVAEPLRADVYQLVDARGVVHLTNVPTMPHYKVVVRVLPPVKNNIGAGRRLQNKSFPYGRVVTKVAREQKLDKALLHAVIAVESAYDPHAVSRAGAVGLMQLMPATARHYGVSDRTDPEANIQGGARYLHDLMGRFHNNLPLVLAAYNAGEDAVIAHGYKIPPYPETRKYVPRVLNLYRQIRASRP